MISIFAIGSVALYEIKTLLRGWFFRIFALLALGIIILLDTFMFTMQRSASWSFRGIPSSIPYLNLLLVNSVQAVIGVFLASDFLKSDRKLDSTEVVYMRSMTNADYVFGKFLGVCTVLFILNVAVLAVSLVFNVFFIDVPVKFLPYVYYPLLISMPTLVFIFGLSFFFMSLIRSQAVTFILLLGYIAGTLFYLGHTYNYLFDYLAYNIPLMYSDFVGFGNIDSLIMQRAIYLLLGIGFMFGTVLLLRRLSQSTAMTRISIALGIICFVGAALLGKSYISNVSSGKDLRNRMTELNRRFSEIPRIIITNCALEIAHKGETIEASALLTFRNPGDSTLDTYVFSLNPGLNIRSVTRDGQELPYERHDHILTVTSSPGLTPGATDSLTINYGGTINEDACYLDIDDVERQKSYSLFIYKIDKRYAFLTPEYVLLTAETLWYPSAGVPYGSVYPEGMTQDFIRFDLKVTTSPELTAISQGAMEQTGEGEYRFKPETPLPKLSLVIGRYEHRTAQAGDTGISLFLSPGHDYFSGEFTTIGEGLPKLLGEIKLDMEQAMKRIYPYRRFTIVEVPIQYFSHGRLWSVTSETVQPEQVFLCEKGVLLFSADFKRMKYWQSHGSRRGETRTPEEVEQDMIRGFAQRTFTGDIMNRRFASMRRNMTSGDGISLQRVLFSSFVPSFLPNYEIFPNYYSYTHHFSSADHPIFNLALELYLQSGLTDNMPGGFRFTGLSDEEIANRALSTSSLGTLLAHPDSLENIRQIITIKSQELFTRIKAEVGEKKFEQFLSEYLNDNMFTENTAADFIDALWIEFGLDLEEAFNRWYSGSELPAFLFSQFKCTEVHVKETTRYQVLFKVTNSEEADGIISVRFMSGGGGQGFGPRMMFREAQEPELDYYTVIRGNESKEIGIVLDSEPRVITVDTFTSLNIPSRFDYRPGKAELDENAVVFEGERTPDQPVRMVEPGEIIVDDEDKGFEILTKQEDNFIRKLIARNGPGEEEYTGMTFWHPPGQWRATTHSDFYGRYIHSAHYIKSGRGDQKVRWTAEIPESGTYDILVNCVNLQRFGQRGERGGSDRVVSDFTFTVHHDDGSNDVSIDMNITTPGWMFLGTFYLSQGPATVDLSDKSSGRIVYADAVKWLKREKNN